MSEYNYQQKRASKRDPFLDSDDDVISCKKIKVPQPSKALPKRLPYSDDSEEDSAISTNKKKEPTKRARKASPPNAEEEGISSKKKVTTTAAKRRREAEVQGSAVISEWLFSDEEDIEQVRQKSTQTESVFSRKVPGGWIRRTGRFSGDLLAELRLYKVEDVKETKGLDRCEKAAVWIRVQGEQDSPLFLQLKKFSNLAKAKFTEEGTFFQEKKKK